MEVTAQERLRLEAFCAMYLCMLHMLHLFSERHQPSPQKDCIKGLAFANSYV